MTTTSDSRIKPVAEIETAHLFDIAVDLDPRRDFGNGPLGRRVLFGAAGGSFEGSRLRGEVLPGGGDWTLFRADGTMTLDVRLILKTDDGALLHMTYSGRWVTPSELRSDVADPRRDTGSTRRATTSARIRSSKPETSATRGSTTSSASDPATSSKAGLPTGSSKSGDGKDSR
jgi:hypothetical protein